MVSQPLAPSQLTIPVTDISAQVVIDRFLLTVVEGPDKGKTLRSEASEIGIGTAEGNDLVLTDSTVSRHHASLTSTPKSFILRDLGSTNGTRVANVRIEVAHLEEQTFLDLGRTKVRFDPLDDSVIELLSPHERFGEVLGKSRVMRHLFAMLPRVAAADATVLLEGETGTGKSRIAEVIHEESSRKTGPFVVLDCSAIPPTLVETELFGHTKGSFTGAISDRPGAFEQADGGTIFIDEVGELPLDMQPKLLRALEERTVKRVGSAKPIKVDVRVIAATNRELREEVNRGGFRADLYFRLHVVRLRVAPLRERPEDIELLTRHFYDMFAPGETPPRALLERLMKHPWPGNVRELRGAVERAVLLGAERMEAPASVSGAAASTIASSEFDPNVPFRVAKEAATAGWEQGYLTALLKHAEGNLSKAARIVKMDRSHLRELLRKYKISATATD